MTPETFESLRTGSDQRFWLVIGGPHDGLQVKPFADAHFCIWRSIPRMKNWHIERIVYLIDHDNHVLEFDPEKNPGFKP